MSRSKALRVADYLQHILEAINNIQDYITGLDLQAFIADRKTRDAVKYVPNESFSSNN